MAIAAVQPAPTSAFESDNTVQARMDHAKGQRYVNESSFVTYHDTLIGSILTAVKAVEQSGQAIPTPLLRVLSTELNHVLGADNAVFEMYHGGYRLGLSRKAGQVLEGLMQAPDGFIRIFAETGRGLLESASTLCRFDEMSRLKPA